MSPRSSGGWMAWSCRLGSLPHALIKMQQEGKRSIQTSGIPVAVKSCGICIKICIRESHSFGLSEHIINVPLSYRPTALRVPLLPIVGPWPRRDMVH